MSQIPPDNPNVVYYRQTYNKRQLSKMLLNETAGAHALFHAGPPEMLKIKTLVAAGADIEVYDDGDGFGDIDYTTPLIYAASGGHMDLAAFLLECGAKTGTASIGGDALMHAAANGHLDMVRLLIAHNADVNATHMLKWTPLMYASAAGHDEIVACLLLNGADAAAKTSWNEDAAKMARDKNHPETAQLIEKWLIAKNVAAVKDRLDHGTATAQKRPKGGLKPPGK